MRWPKRGAKEMMEPVYPGTVSGEAAKRGVKNGPLFCRRKRALVRNNPLEVEKESRSVPNAISNALRLLGTELMFPLVLVHGAGPCCRKAAESKAGDGRDGSTWMS